MRSLKTLAVLATFAMVSSAFAADITSSGTTTSGSTSSGTTTVSASGAALSTSLSGFAALNVKGAPLLVKKDATTVTLEWNKVDTAASYIVKYSKKSVAASSDPTATYDMETSPVTATGTTVDKLTENTTYYFSVVAIDKDGNESESFSDELAVNLSAATSFAVAKVSVVDVKTITVDFTADLGTSPVSVKIQKASNNAAVTVMSVTPDTAVKTRALVTLSTPLDPSSAYSLTVLSAKDALGNTIPEGINAIKEFTTTASLAPSPEVALNAATASGEALSGAAVTPGSAVEAAKALPKTGTEENLLILAALLLSLGIVFVIHRRNA